jgi:hypothetical protein
MTTARKAPAKKVPAKKRAAKKTAQETDNCWPGYKPVAGKMSGEKGSCEKKATQTRAEKQADGRAAGASKREKG